MKLKQGLGQVRFNSSSSSRLSNRLSSKFSSKFSTGQRAREREKNEEIVARCSDQFQELLQAVAEEHVRELEAQKMKHEESLRAFRAGMDSGVGKTPSSLEVFNSVKTPSSLEVFKHTRSATQDSITAFQNRTATQESIGAIGAFKNRAATHDSIGAFMNRTATQESIGAFMNHTVPRSRSAHSSPQESIGAFKNGSPQESIGIFEDSCSAHEEMPEMATPLPSSIPTVRVTRTASANADVGKEPVAPMEESTSQEPQSPTEPPPALCMPVQTTQLLMNSPASGDEEAEDGDGLASIVPSRKASYTAHDRSTVQTIQTCDGRTTQRSNADLPTGSPTMRCGMFLNDVHAKWANLVQCALDTASMYMYFPRQIWKDGLSNKYAPSSVAVNSAAKHLRKMMSNVSSCKTTVIKGNSLMDLGTLMAANVNNPTKCEALDPHSGPRLAWTFMGMILMFYDLLYIPMQAFQPPYNGSFYVIDMAAQVYWTLDIGCNFLTGVYVKSMLEKRFARIARIYARTWLGFDLLVTMPLWYSVMIQDSSELTNLVVIRFVRLSRFLKLFRLAKFDRVLREALEIINSPHALLVIGTIKIMVALCIFNHVITCLWFGIGNRSGGWVGRFDLDDTPILDQYLSSTHWALSQYQGNSEIVPGTVLERGYTVVFQLMALIILACFVSTLTTNMGQLQELHDEKHSQQRAVRSYLNENGISTHLCVQVNRYVEWHRRQKHRKQQDAEVLFVLPTKLLMDLFDEVRGPVLAVHPFFSTFRTQFSRVCRCIIYEALEQMSPCPSELVYAEGDECHHMYFVMSGQLRYEPHPTSFGRVKKVINHWEDEIDKEDNQILDNVLESAALRPTRVEESEWLSEAVLWTEWEHHGNLIALEDCALLMLAAERFSGIVKKFNSARSVASLYARNFVVGLNRFGHTYTDWIDHADLFDYDEYERLEEPEDGTHTRELTSWKF